jgi:hypothetical protein
LSVSQAPREIPCWMNASRAYSEQEGTKRHAPGNNGESSNLYPRSRTRATETAVECLSEFAFNGSQAGVEQVSLWHHDDVDAGGGLVATKNLSNQSFRSISYDGAAEFFGGRDAQAADLEFIRQGEHREEPSVDPGAAIVDSLIFDAAADPFVPTESGHPAGLFAADGQTLAAFCAAPLENEAPVLGRHANEKPMRTGTMPRIGLKSAYSLGHVLTPENS